VATPAIASITISAILNGSKGFRGMGFRTAERWQIRLRERAAQSLRQQAAAAVESGSRTT
jgi:hypothetical protein